MNLNVNLGITLGFNRDRIVSYITQLVSDDTSISVPLRTVWANHQRDRTTAYTNRAVVATDTLVSHSSPLAPQQLSRTLDLRVAPGMGSTVAAPGFSFQTSGPTTTPLHSTFNGGGGASSQAPRTNRGTPAFLSEIPTRSNFSFDSAPIYPVIP
jgi:hypothetical protein